MADARNISLRLLTAAGLAGLLAGCASTGEVSQPSGPELVQSDKALVMPPPGGPAIVGVVETRRSNGVEQALSLATSSSVPGQNYIRVSYRGAETGEGGPSSGYRPVGDYEIRREIAAAAPGVRLSRNATFLQNAYGPFGYASGLSRSGDACLYGWQQIRSRSVGGGIGRDFGMIQVRFRICDNRATERELLSIMYGYTIVGTFQGEIWNPYGSPAGADPRLGATGQPIYPNPDPEARAMAFGYSTTPVSVSAPASRPRIAVRPVPAAPAVQQAVVPLPAATGPRVPLPDAAVQDAAGVPRSSPAGVMQNAGRPPKVAVPSPDCIGAASAPVSCSGAGR